jgi:hypothetical protein
MMSDTCEHREYHAINHDAMMIIHEPIAHNANKPPNHPSVHGKKPIMRMHDEPVIMENAHEG